jgi:outer membrane protein OmpA-like peptidoglycan-associated protein
MQKLGLALVQIAAVIAVSLSGACATAPQAKQSPPLGVDAEATVRQHLADLEAKGPLHFETDTDELDAPSREVLRQVAKQMFLHPRVKVVVSGHADERGDTAYNLSLGERRAKAAQDFLVRIGVPRGRINTVSLGEEAPLLDGHDESAWAQNRRDEFTFVLPGRVIAEGDAGVVDVLLAQVTLTE